MTEYLLNENLIYIIAINLVTLILFIILKRNINKVENRRKEELEDQSRFNPVNTKSPNKKPVQTARKMAMQNVGMRFSIIRRIFFIGLVIIWMIAISVPFLSTFSAQFLSLVITATSVIIGIAARPYIENIISGIVISFSRQLNTGDTVLIDERYGTVEDITLSHTSVKMWDWRRYIIPNSVMLQKEFVNYSIHDDDMWAYISFWVSYDSDLERVKEIAVSIAENHKCVINYEAPKFWVMDATKEGINCWLAAWTTFYDAWSMKSELRSELCIQFQKEGILTHSYNINAETIDRKR